MSDKCAEHHGDAVAGVILRCKRCRCFPTIPIKSRGKNRLRKIGIWKPICPLPLSLKATCYRISTKCFLVPTQLVQFAVSIQNVPHNQCHFYDELPIMLSGNHFGIRNDARECFDGILVETLSAVRPNPRKGALILRHVINSDLHSAQNLDLIHPFGADAKILL